MKWVGRKSAENSRSEENEIDTRAGLENVTESMADDIYRRVESADLPAYFFEAVLT